MAYEGTSLSLLGLIKYDSKTDSFMMTKLACIISGGLKEAKQALDNKIACLNAYRDNLVKVGCVALGLGAYFIL